MNLKDFKKILICIKTSLLLIQYSCINYKNSVLISAFEYLL